MRLRDLVLSTAFASAGLLIYGCLYAANRLVVERRTLRLKGWPQSLRGYTIAVLADLHVRDRYSVELGRHAVELALEADPDLVVLPGDIVAYWKRDTPWLLEQVMADLGGGGTRLDPSLDEQLEVMLEQYEDMLELYGTHIGVNLARKHIGWYTKGLPGSAVFRHRMNQLESVAEQMQAITDFFEEQKTSSERLLYEGELAA